MSEKQQTDAEYFAEIDARKKAMAEQLAASPIQNILGLVDTSSKGGWQEDNQWTFSFKFHAWKNPPGSLKTKPLSVQMTGSRQDFDSLMERIKSFMVVRITARVVEESIIGTSEAQLLEFHGNDSSDSELSQAAVELQQPVIYQDSQFGNCTLDRRVGWYIAETKWGGTEIELKLQPNGDGKLDAALRVARELWNKQTDWAKRIQDYAVQELLPLKNENWLEDGEQELTPKQFEDKMTLETIKVDSDGSFEFWHNDGDLFWGHYIQVSGNLNDGLMYADIPG